MNLEKQKQNYRTPSIEEFEQGIFTCQDCEHSNISIIDKKAIRQCSIGNFIVRDNDTCDDIKPLNLSTDA